MSATCGCLLLAGTAAGVVAATGIGNAGLSEALAGVAAAGKGVEAASSKIQKTAERVDKVNKVVRFA